MSSGEPSAIVLQGIPRMCGIYTSFDFESRKRSLKARAIQAE